MIEAKTYICTGRSLTLGMCVLHGTFGESKGNSFIPGSCTLRNIVRIDREHRDAILVYFSNVDCPTLVGVDERVLVVKTSDNLNP